MNNKELHIIMPLAGEGSRFKSEGINTPKPLLKIDNMHFYDKAIHSLWGLFRSIYKDVQIKFTFIVRDEHIENYNIDKIIKNRYYNANIISVKETTRGAVETCLLATPYIDINDSILILDCDLFFTSYTYEKLLGFILRTTTSNSLVDGVVLSFKSNSNKYSYAKVNDGHYVIGTAEKNPISDNALCGAYFFTKSQDFLYAAQTLIEENDVKDIKEYYISLLYNYLIKAGKKIKCATVNEYYSFGTPEELKDYENRSNYN